jgi:hypothetical protein
LTGGQTHDITQAPALIENIAARSVTADKSYDCKALVASIQASGAQAVIPSHITRLKQRDYDRHQ